MAMTMELIWLEIWEMGMLKERERIMKAIRSPRDSIFSLLRTQIKPPTTASAAYWT